MKKFLPMVGLVLGGLAIAGFGQSPLPTPVSSNGAEVLRQQAELERQNAEFRRKAATPPDFGHNDEARPPARPEVPGPTAMSPSREQKARLSPSAEDLAKYADVLRRSNARLIKLFPDAGCVDIHVIRADDPCLGFIPYSSFYSFRKANYTRKTLSDIGLKDGAFLPAERLRMA